MTLLDLIKDKEGMPKKKGYTLASIHYNQCWDEWLSFLSTLEISEEKVQELFDRNISVDRGELVRSVKGHRVSYIRPSPKVRDLGLAKAICNTNIIAKVGGDK